MRTPDRAAVYDVVVIGAGGAGVTAAITAAEAGARVAVLSKDPVGYGNTRISGGGVASETVPKELIADVTRSGAGLAEPATVRAMAEEAEEAMACLARFGQVFLTEPTGAYKTYRLGGHSKDRMLQSPRNGTSLTQALRGAVAGLDVDFGEEMMVCELMREDGRIAGAVAHDLVSGRFRTFRAPAVILATGGAGWLFHPHTDNTKSVTGDGFALALAAGSGLVDMEQVQFLPLSVVHPRSMRGVFAGEPSRVGGPRGVLRDAEGGLILDELDKRKRDEVSNVVFAAIRQGPVTDAGGILLDLSGNREVPAGSPELHAWKRPSGAVRQAYGRAAFFGHEPFPIQPTAHHMMGGVRTDVDGRAAVKGLFAAGEARGGVHGANRLGGMALLDNVVFGRRAGVAAAALASRDGAGAANANTGTELLEEELDRAKARKKGRRAAELKRELTDAVWLAMGGARSADRCAGSLARLRRVGERMADCRIAANRRWNLDALDYLELRAMVPTAEAILLAAQLRTESRGAHVWEENPDRDPELEGKRTLVSVKDGALSAQWEAVPYFEGPEAGPSSYRSSAPGAHRGCPPCYYPMRDCAPVGR